jgi:hypothetical protein
LDLKTQLSEYIQACFTGIYVQSHEHADALQEIAQLCQQNGWSLATWNIATGLKVRGTEIDANATDPTAAIKAISSLARPEGSAVLVLENFHRFMQSAEVIQMLAEQIHAGKQNRTFIVILAPTVTIPPELDKQFGVLEHALPDRTQLEDIARGVAIEANELPDDLQPVLDASCGLTRNEAENAYSLSLVRHGHLQADTIWELKTQQLKKSGLLTLHRGSERFDDLGGLDSLKAFTKRAMRRHSNVSAKGVMLLGVPGTGKSAFAKALGNETGRPTLVMDIGSLMGSLVGQSESNIRQALQIVDAMAPAVLFIDEAEKALSGVASSGQTDSGVSARLFGNFLSWLNDHDSDVIVVCTCNDISKLPPEFARAERFDGIFFLDLPGNTQKEMIWQLYLRQYELDAEQERPADAQWTGAEIKACCRLAALLDLPLVAAAENVVPVAVTAAESVEKLRSWASGRCLDAEKAGIYHGGALTGRRRVSGEPSSN